MDNEKHFQTMQQFRFQEQFHSVRSMVDQAGEPWFVAKDVCDILGLDNNRKAVMNLDDDEKGVTKGYTLGGEQELIIINESGLYNLIFRSNKPQAKVFRKWVTAEVLPAIRKQGHYGLAHKAQIPEEPDQVLAMWAYLARAERSLSSQLRTIRQVKGSCLLRLQETAAPYVMPESHQIGLSFVPN